MRSLCWGKKRLSMLLSAVLMVTLLITIQQAQEYYGNPREALTDQFFATMGRSLDLVVRGVILGVEAKWIPDQENFGVGDSTIVTELLIRVEEILAGEYDKDDIVAYLTEGRVGQARVQVAGPSPPPQVEVGDTVIIGLRDYMERDYRYINKWPEAFFKVEEEKLIPYKNEFFVQSDNPLQTMEISARKRELPHLYRNAEYVCTGTVVQNDANGCLLHLRVDELWKGTVDEQLIDVDYKNDVDLSRNEVGTRMLVFLKGEETGYRLYSGMNSVYTIQGDRLVRGSSLLVTTFSQAKKVFARLRKEME